MKIQVVGTSCTWFQRQNTSFIINDEILLDVPQGSYKDIVNMVDANKIKALIFTHFHSDHFGDFHIFASLVFHNKPKIKIKVLAPRGARQKLIKLFKVFEIKHQIPKIKDYFEFITIKNKAEITLGEYSFKFYSVMHSNLDGYGLTVKEKTSKRIVGFTGDTGICKNACQLVAESDDVFIDCSGLVGCQKHMGADNLMQFRKEHQNKKFYPVHMNDIVYENFKNEIKDGVVYIVK